MKILIKMLGNLNDVNRKHKNVCFIVLIIIFFFLISTFLVFFIYLLFFYIFLYVWNNSRAQLKINGYFKYVHIFKKYWFFFSFCSFFFFSVNLIWYEIIIILYIIKFMYRKFCLLNVSDAQLFFFLPSFCMVAIFSLFVLFFF
jgi:hypothetical protein